MCTADGTYLMALTRVELLNNGLLSMPTPEDGPIPVVQSDPSMVVIREQPPSATTDASAVVTRG